MGTRGLYGYIEGEKYTANYNHFDSYPSGLGVEFWKSCIEGRTADFEIEEEAISFIEDSLFCEWAYFYDPDTGIFEIWKGFQKVPDPQNPFGVQKNNGYYPCKRIFRGDITDLTETDFESENFKSKIRELKINNVLKNNLENEKN